MTDHRPPDQPPGQGRPGDEPASWSPVPQQPETSPPGWWQPPYAQGPQAPYAQGPQAPYAQGPQAPYAQGPQAPYAQGPQAPYAQGPQAPYAQGPYVAGQDGTAPHPQSSYGAQYGQGLYGQNPYAPGPYAGLQVAGPAPLPRPMPEEERSYPQLLRGPQWRWWKPLLALLLAGAIALAGQAVALVPFIGFGAIATGGQDLGGWIARELRKLAAADIDAAGFFYTNLGLIALIPAAGLSVWAVHHIRPKFVSSVVGGFRWRWLGRCLIVVVPLWAVYGGLGLVLDTPTGTRPTEWVLLLILVVVMTPFQAAGEEYFFRGWILQNVGSWFKRPMLALIVPTIVSAAAFSAAHGSMDIWIVASLVVFAVSCCVLTWRTGGLEAAIAIHAVNNVSAFFAVINFGGWNEAFIGGETKGTPVQFLVDAAVQVIAFALIWWQAKRGRITSRYRPAVEPPTRSEPLPLPSQSYGG